MTVHNDHITSCEIYWDESLNMPRWIWVVRSGDKEVMRQIESCQLSIQQVIDEVCWIFDDLRADHFAILKDEGGYACWFASREDRNRANLMTGDQK